MLIGPELRTLRIDDGPQRTAQAAMRQRIQAWRDSIPVRAVDDALAEYAEGAEIESISVLADLMTARAARKYAGYCINRLVRALDAQPLGHVALRHFHDALRSSLVISRVGNVILSLETRVQGAAPRAAPKHCVLNDVASREVVIAGAMDGRLIAVAEGEGRATFSAVPVTMRVGDTSIRDGRREVLAIERIEHCFTTLRLQRQAAIPEPARAYDFTTGALVGQACAEVDTSRRSLMISLLGRMSRAEDAPLLADIARAAGEPGLRWEAVRECLGLDSATGFHLLGELGHRTGDPIRNDAAALRRQLLTRHPQLAALEDDTLCPA